MSRSMGLLALRYQPEVVLFEGLWAATTNKKQGRSNRGRDNPDGKP
mgnify:CR=1 FL=1